MCDPTMMMIASVASTAFQTLGAYSAAKAEKQQLKYQASIDEQNRKIADYNAQAATERGEIEEKQRRLEISQDQGSQLAMLAANGMDIGDGSALDIMADTAFTGELDALTIRDNARREAFGYEVDAYNKSASAVMKRSAASNISPLGSALGTLATEGAKTGAKYEKYSSEGAWKTKPTKGGSVSAAGRAGGMGMDWRV